MRDEYDFSNGTRGAVVQLPPGSVVRLPFDCAVQIADQLRQAQRGGHKLTESVAQWAESVLAEEKRRHEELNPERALEIAWKLLSGLLTDSQLDFRQPDGWTARERLDEIKRAIDHSRTAD